MTYFLSMFSIWQNNPFKDSVFPYGSPRRVFPLCLRTIFSNHVIILQWRWRKQVPPECGYLSIKLHGVKSRKILSSCHY